MRRYIVQKDLMEENIRLVQQAAGTALLYGVLKVNGYGLGLEPMARMLAAQGIDHFAVTEPSDVMAVCGFGLPVAEVLLMRPVTEPETLDKLLPLPVTFSVGSSEDAEALSQAGQRTHITPHAHIQVDTGLGRFGFTAGKPEVICRIYEQYEDIHFTGIYTHFTCGANRRLTERQFQRFQGTVKGLEQAGITVGLRHCASSPALFHYPEARLDAVRIGSALLGRIPEGERFGLKPVGVCEATIDEVKALPAGMTVGYSALFHAKHDMKTATVCVGAVNGVGMEVGGGKKDFSVSIQALLRQALHLVRRRSGLCANVNGHTAYALGVVCTEAVILDVTGIDCRQGDRVLISMNPLYQRRMDCVWIDSRADESAEKNSGPV
ncbi:MAG: alanine racemase [Oscillospiraceae bacterium]|nr:alanine racemase [Oscillospiraceae bacterium]